MDSGWEGITITTTYNEARRIERRNSKTENTITHQNLNICET